LVGAALTAIPAAIMPRLQFCSATFQIHGGKIMRKVSLIAAVFFAVAWLAVAEEKQAPPAPPQYTPGPMYNAMPADDGDAPKPIPRPIYDPTNPDPAYHLPPATNNWQIHRTDSETLLLNTSTGETWFLDRTGDRQYKWQRIARDGAPPPPAYHPPVLGQPPQEGERPAQFFQDGDFVPASNRS
jgi:hypothetical protein